MPKLAPGRFLMSVQLELALGGVKERTVRKISFLVIAAASVFFVHIDRSFAVVVLSESFSYPDGSLVGATGSPWTNNSGTLGQQNVVSGELFLDDDDTEDTRAEFAGTTLATGLTTGILTATFQMRVTSTDAPSSGVGQYVAHLIGDSDTLGVPNSHFAAIYLRDAAGTAFNLGLGNTSVAGGSATYFSTALNADENYNLTLSLDIDAGTSSLSVTGLGVISATDTAATIARMNAFGFRQIGASGDAFFDNLAVVYTVPEASSFLFGGLALCAAGAPAINRRLKARKAG